MIRRDFLSITTAAALAAGNLANGAMAQTSQTTLAGRRVVYQVADYRIQMEFLSEDEIRWTYLAAPEGEAGKTATESVDRVDLRPELVLISWTEADNTHVVDVFDFDNQRLHAAFITPDGQRFMSTAEFVRED